MILFWEPNFSLLKLSLERPTLWGRQICEPAAADGQLLL